MADKIIAAELRVATGDANANIKEVNKNLNEVKGNLSATGTTAGKVGKDIEGAGGSFLKLKESIGSLPGPLGQAASGVTGLQAQLLKLLANPIGLVLAAIVVVLGALYKAFTNTFAGGQKVEQVFAAIGAVGQSLIDNLDKIGSAIVKVFSFDFSGAIEDIKEVGNAAAESFNKMAALTAEAQNLKREQLANDLDGAERAKKLAILREQAGDDTISISKRKAALQELKADAEQNSKDDIDLAKRVTENKIAQLTLQKDGALKNQEEITKLKIEQINVETDNANELRRIQKQITGIDRQEAAERKAIADKAQEQAKIRIDEQKKLAEEQIKLQKQLQADFSKLRTEEQTAQAADIARQAKDDEAKAQAEIKRLETNEALRLETKKKLAELALVNDPDSSINKVAKIKADLDVELAALAEGDLQKQILAQQAANNIVAIEKEANEKKISDAQAVADAKRAIQEQEIGVIQAGVGLVTSIFGKSKAIQKAGLIAESAVGVAKMIISNNAANIAALATPAAIATFGASAIPVIAANNIRTAIGVAATLAATVKGISALGGGGSPGSAPSVGGSGGGGGSAPAAPVTPQAQATLLDQNQLNNAGSAVATRAFLVESDVTSNQEKIARLSRAARLGGG